MWVYFQCLSLLVFAVTNPILLHSHEYRPSSPPPNDLCQAATEMGRDPDRAMWGSSQKLRSRYRLFIPISGRDPLVQGSANSRTSGARLWAEDQFAGRSINKDIHRCTNIFIPLLLISLLNTMRNIMLLSPWTQRWNIPSNSVTSRTVAVAIIVWRRGDQSSFSYKFPRSWSRRCTKLA